MTTVLLAPSLPPSYHRINSPTLHIPTDTRKPIPVGLLACQRDPLLRELISQVVSRAIAQSHPVSAAEKRAKKEKASLLSKSSLLEVVLHDTILFPEGGGQPNDIGIITTPGGDEWDVIDVKRHGGHAVHYVRIKDGDPGAAMRAFDAGATVAIALGEDGFQRRLDHMCIHTAQHLLSAVLETEFKLPTLSWSLTEYPTPSYVEVPRAMTVEEVASAQEIANRYVFEGRQVHIEVEELDPQNLPGVATTESGRNVGKALPTDYTGGVKRTVVIDGVDRNPCCGTHLPSLHNLQLFLLPHTEGLSRSTTTTARLYFLAGPRLITYLTSTHSSLMTTSQILSCGPSTVPERVQQIVEDRKKANKRVEDLESELATAIGKELAASAVAEIAGSAVLYHHRVDDSSNAIAFLSSISAAFAEQLRPPQPYLVILSSSPSMQLTSSTTVLITAGSDEKKVKVVGDGLKSSLGIKGGGKGTRWSGKFAGVWKPSREGRAVEEVLEEVLKGATQNSRGSHAIKDREGVDA